MLTLYKRHLSRCKHGKSDGSEGRGIKSCGCPIWAQGVLRGKKIRRSTGCTNFKAAENLAARWEGEGNTQARSAYQEIPFTIQRFLDDCEARGLTKSTIAKYRNLLRTPAGKDPNTKRLRSITLEEYCAEKGLISLADISADDLRQFRERQLDAPISASKKLERLKAFFRFAVESGWLAASPAAKLKPSSLKSVKPTQPLTDDEIEAMQDAIPLLKAQQSPWGAALESRHLDRLQVLLRVLEFSGLRISDAVKLSVGDIVDGKLRLQSQTKTQEPVYVPLPDDLIRQLDELPLLEGKYFWVGGRWETAAGNYRRSLRRLRALIGRPGIHPHRWRDTFAVRLLEQGVPMEVVSQLLGHTSIKTTEAHYSPWYQRRQQQAQEAVAKVWQARGKKKAVAGTPAKLRRVK